VAAREHTPHSALLLSILFRFNWNGTATAPDFYGEEKDCDFYISPDGTFKYWTELVSPPTSHHDIFFRDGGGAFWAWSVRKMKIPCAQKLLE
jgi:hypothetical protein